MGRMHPADQLSETKSTKLRGNKIVLGITGSIAAVESVKLCRELIRHGAEVHVVMSKDAQCILHPWAMEFASGRPVTTEIDGRVQHVAFCGEVPDRADLFIIAPCTANTISKIACGIDDTPVTTFATTALGSGIPVIVVPAMHGSMIKHRVVQDNLVRLKDLGVTVLQPKMEESKAKIPDNSSIVSAVLAILGKRDLVGRRVLVIAGATEEPLDDVRVLTNRSSGETGVELAIAAHERGATVELWVGRCDTHIPDHIPHTRFASVSDLMTLASKIDHDIVLFPAAVSDYSPSKVDGKMRSDEDEIIIRLKRNPKIIDTIRAKVVVGFKAQAKVDDVRLVEDAMALLKRSGCSFVVANRMEDVTRGRTRVSIVKGEGSAEVLEGTKPEVASDIIDIAARLVR
jgi:phosphopantothenoylcysteine decarboxylase/phosphopantothenate--cysteine ligase